MPAGDDRPGGGGLGHFGLALRFYTHFTSPIRRYADVVVHRQLRAALARERGGAPAPPLPHAPLTTAAGARPRALRAAGGPAACSSQALQPPSSAWAWRRAAEAQRSHQRGQERKLQAPLPPWSAPVPAAIGLG